MNGGADAKVSNCSVGQKIESSYLYLRFLLYPVWPKIATGNAGKLRQKNDGNPRPNQVYAQISWLEVIAEKGGKKN